MQSRVRLHRAKSTQIKNLNEKLNTIVAEYLIENEREELTKADIKWLVDRHFPLLDTINKLEASA